MSELSIFLNKLINDESVSSVNIAESIQHVVKTMVDIGAIDMCEYGQDQRYVLNNTDVLKNYLHQYYPDDSKLVSRRNNQSKSRKDVDLSSAKRSMAQGMATASMRFFSGALTYPDVNIDACRMTRDLGVVSAQIYSDTPLRMECRKVSVVENLELFYYVEHLDETIDCALYASERLHNALLDWLAKHGQEIEVIYFGAYTTSGVQEYLRLQNRLKTCVSFYLPDNIDDLFSNYADRDLLNNNVEDYRKISHEDDDSIKKLVDLMARHGGGLEQEVLLMGDG